MNKFMQTAYQYQELTCVNAAVLFVKTRLTPRSLERERGAQTLVHAPLPSEKSSSLLERLEINSRVW